VAKERKQSGEIAAYNALPVLVGYYDAPGVSQAESTEYATLTAMSGCNSMRTLN
jgi:hypothetical protein